MRLQRLRRAVWYSSKQHEQSCPTSAMFTLTYAPGVEPQPEHIKGFLLHFRRWCQSQRIPCRYVWVAEVQEQRGMLHYHVVAFFPARRKNSWLPKPDRQGWWPHGMTERDWAKTAVGYVMKYATKCASKGGIPKGFRMHGAGGFDDHGRQGRAHHLLPTWIRNQTAPEHRVTRIRGGFLSRLTGEFFETPWQVIGFGHAAGFGSFIKLRLKDEATPC